MARPSWRGRGRSFRCGSRQRIRDGRPSRPRATGPGPRSGRGGQGADLASGRSRSSSQSCWHSTRSPSSDSVRNDSVRPSAAHWSCSWHWVMCSIRSFIQSSVFRRFLIVGSSLTQSETSIARVRTLGRKADSVDVRGRRWPKLKAKAVPARPGVRPRARLKPMSRRNLRKNLTEFCGLLGRAVGFVRVTRTGRAERGPRFPFDNGRARLGTGRIVRWRGVGMAPPEAFSTAETRRAGRASAPGRASWRAGSSAGGADRERAGRRRPSRSPGSATSASAARPARGRHDRAGWSGRGSTGRSTTTSCSRRSPSGWRCSTDEVRAFDELAPSVVQDWILPLREEYYAPQEAYLDHLAKLVEAIGRAGESIIVGRGANFLLPREETLSVRIIAPLKARAARLAERMGVSVRTARRAARDLDRRRIQFDRTMHRADSDRPAQLRPRARLEQPRPDHRRRGHRPRPSRPACRRGNRTVAGRPATAPETSYRAEAGVRALWSSAPGGRVSRGSGRGVRAARRSSGRSGRPGRRPRAGR